MNSPGISIRFLIPVLMFAVLTGLSAGCEPTDQQQEETVKSKRDATDARNMLDSIVGRARMYGGQGAYADAVVQWKRAAGMLTDDPRMHMELANAQFLAGHIRDSITTYDRIIELDATAEARLWQRGLALYYAGEYELAKKQFETHQTVNSADVENAVWHMLSAAKVDGVEKARENLIPIVGDPRVPMPEIYQLFAGQAKLDDVVKAAEAKGRSPLDSRQQKYYAQLYIGLYQEMMGESEKSLATMEEAIKLNPLGPVSFMGQVARIHSEIRKREMKKKASEEKEKNSKTDGSNNK